MRAAFARLPLRGVVPLVVIGMVVLPVAGRAQASKTAATPIYTGTFDPQIVMDTSYDTILLQLASPSDRQRLPESPGANTRVYTGTLELSESDTAGRRRKSLPMALLVTPGQASVLYFHTRDDSVFTIADRHVFHPSHGDHVPADQQETLLTIPLPGTVFAEYPIRILDRPVHPIDPAAQGYIIFRSTARAQGHIMLNGRSTLARFDVGPITGAIVSPVWISLDVLGTGDIDAASRTENQLWGLPNIPVMFKVGDAYVRPGTFDVRAGTFTMIGLDRRDYVPAIDTGVVLANFAFTALNGRAHQLSEYRGKYVLLYFWSAHCESCVGPTFKAIRSAYDTHKDHGFEPVGVNVDTDVSADTLTKFLARHNANWAVTSYGLRPTGAALAAFADLHVRGWYCPFSMLIGPDGRIVATDEALVPDKLDKTLESFIPVQAASNELKGQP